MRDETRLVSGGRRPEWTGPIVNPPVHRASTILFDDCAALKRGAGRNADGEFHYGRRGTPTQWALAEALTELEPGAEGTMLFPSGVAAIACALLAVLKSGDELLMVDSVYGPTRAFCDNVLAGMGIATRYYDPLVGAGIAELIGDGRRAIFLESPGSLTFEVQDVPAIVAVGQGARDRHAARQHLGDAAVLARDRGGDRSLDPGLHQICRRPFGRDAGIGDRDAGPLSGAAPDGAAVRPACRARRRLSRQPRAAHARGPAQGARGGGAGGGTLAGDAARGGARAASRAAVLPGPRRLGARLQGRDRAVHLHPDGGDAQRARAALIDGLAHFGIGYSWGGYESLALPVDPAGLRTVTRWQAEGPAVRLHIGLEHPDDLIADLRAGLDRYTDSI